MTDYGIVQFTVTDKTGNGGQWYGMAGRESLYAGWEMTAVQEIYSDTLSFMVSDNTGFYDDRLFVVEADENTTRCQMLFNSLVDADMKNSQPQVIVYEREGDEMNEIMRLDVPMGNSLPSYCWRNSDGEVRLLLSSVDFLLCDAPAVSYCGNDIIVAEVSVQMNDGSIYVILSDSEKKCHKFFGTLNEAGLWNCFDRVIDLADVVSFTVDGEEFCVENAVIE